MAHVLGSLLSNIHTPRLADVPGGTLRDRPPPRLHVLVAEHHDAVRDLLAAALPRYGFLPWVASRSGQALALSREHHADIAAVLLSDWLGELSGPETLAALRAISRRVRCCFLAEGDHPEAELLAAGAAAVLAKPFRLDRLAETPRRLSAEC